MDNTFIPKVSCCDVVSESPSDPVLPADRLATTRHSATSSLPPSDCASSVCVTLFSLSAVLQGMEIIKQAVVCDNADELDQALSLYRQGLGYFMTGLKYVKNDNAKKAIREKMNSSVYTAANVPL